MQERRKRGAARGQMQGHTRRGQQQLGQRYPPRHGSHGLRGSTVLRGTQRQRQGQMGGAGRRGRVIRSPGLMMRIHPCRAPSGDRTAQQPINLFPLTSCRPLCGSLSTAPRRRPAPHTHTVEQRHVRQGLGQRRRGGTLSRAPLGAGVQPFRRVHTVYMQMHRNMLQPRHTHATPALGLQTASLRLLLAGLPPPATSPPAAGWRLAARSDQTPLPRSGSARAPAPLHPGTGAAPVCVWVWGGVGWGGVGGGWGGGGEPEEG